MVKRAYFRTTAWVLSAAALPAALGCKPNLGSTASLIDRNRVLAIQSKPAERAPGVMSGVDFSALFVSPDENATPDDLQWSLCNVRKAIAVIGPAALQCYAPAGKGLEPIGMGAGAHAVIDKDDCSLFGPSPPMPKEGEPMSRPADADSSGGYYHPVRVLVPTGGEPDYVVGVTRLACGLAGATQDQSLTYADQYRPNENPRIDKLVVRHKGGREESLPIPADAETPDTVPSVAVSPGERVTARATWGDCPLTSTCGDGMCGAGEYPADRVIGRTTIKGCPEDCKLPDSPDGPSKGCTGSEPYVVLDVVARKIVDHRETMSVSWFATDGTFDNEVTGRTEEEAKNAFSENDWVAPNAKGKVRAWAVLRDDRGGVGWAELSFDVGG